MNRSYIVVYVYCSRRHRVTFCFKFDQSCTPNEVNGRLDGRINCVMHLCVPWPAPIGLSRHGDRTVLLQPLTIYSALGVARRTYE